MVYGTKRGIKLYSKFAILMIVVGMLPMMLLSFFIANQILKDYYNTMQYQYEQTADYILEGIDNILESYNNISKLPYYYSLSTGSAANSYSFDNFRKMVYGENYSAEDWELEREQDMDTFLQYIGTVDNKIDAVHFVLEELNGETAGFHYSTYSTYFRSEEVFLNQVGYENLDKESNQLMIIPTHEVGYYRGLSNACFTVARNYFDVRGDIGERNYVGTIYIDVSVEKIRTLLNAAKFTNEEVVYIVNENGDCFYSNEEQYAGKNISESINALENGKNQLVICSAESEYGINIIVVIDTDIAFSGIRKLQIMMVVVLIAASIILGVCAVYFSKRLTRPIHEMMSQMEQIETGNFDIEIPVRSGDEIGILSQRFNQMSAALENYINQSYLARIKQTEAELTALKSQIYPHFLYNTLEVIRMTAVEDGNDNVSEMIEALSEQIHYIIGPMQDMVSLEKEIDIVRKYVYLLNCRIKEAVQLVVRVPRGKTIIVPKLILQPVVENAYIHGIKGRKENGNILIEATVEDDTLEIAVLDNGVGMTQKALDSLHELLKGNEPGIKNQDNWQSIGLKNVHDRINYLFGEGYGIKVTSTLEVGTMVRIIMPYQENEEENHSADDIGGR